MDDLELMRYVTIGQYLPIQSPLHQRDPRVKILGLILLITSVILQPGLTGLLASLLIILGLVRLARVPLKFASGGLAPALPFLILLAILQLLFGWGSQTGANCSVIWRAGPLIAVTSCSVSSVLIMVMRLVCLVFLISLLTLTSTLAELTHGIESLLRPFRRLGLPAHEIAMVMTIALRFVPTLTEDVEKILKAQIARGANIRMGSNPIQRTRHILPVLIPIFISTLRKAEWLADAMTARGYNGSTGRSHYLTLHFNQADILALLLCGVVSVSLLLLPFPALDKHLLGLLIPGASQ